MRRPIVAVVVIVILAVLTMTPALASQSSRHARAELVDTDGNTVGVAQFVERPNGRVLVTLHVNGLTPGEHGVHIHAIGACSPTFSAAGGHFNPTGQLHGMHAGDLGNIVARHSGRANMTSVDTAFTLSAGEMSLFDTDGSAIVIHARADDLVTDPSGNSGGRVACGVIGPLGRGN